MFFPLLKYDTYRYHLPHQWFQVQRYFKMMTCRLANPATSLNHRNHFCWNRMKPLCDILWWLSCNRRVKHQSKKTTCLEDHKLQRFPAFQGRPYWHCEATGRCVNKPVVVGSVLDILQRWRNSLDLLEPIGAYDSEKSYTSWCFTKNWGTGSFRNIMYKVSKNIQKVVVCDFFSSTGLMILMRCHWASSILEQDLEGFTSFPFIGIKK